MPWKHASQLRINGGPGLPADFFRKPGEPTERQLAQRNLEKQLLRLNIPRHYAWAILALKLRPKAQGHVLTRIVELRVQLKETLGKLASIRQQIKELLTKGEPNVSQTVPDLCRLDRPE